MACQRHLMQSWGEATVYVYSLLVSQRMRIFYLVKFFKTNYIYQIYADTIRSKNCSWKWSYILKQDASLQGLQPQFAFTVFQLFEQTNYVSVLKKSSVTNIFFSSCQHIKINPNLNVNKAVFIHLDWFLHTDMTLAPVS